MTAAEERQAAEQALVGLQELIGKLSKQSQAKVGRYIDALEATTENDDCFCLALGYVATKIGLEMSESDVQH